MIPFDLGPHKFNLPTSYDELTFRQFFAMREVKDDDNIGFLAAISGLEREAWEQCSDIDIATKIYVFLEWMKEPFQVEQFTPDKIKINGKYYDRPKGLGASVYGQIEHIKSEYKKLDREGKNDYEGFPMLLAIIMQPVVTGQKYNYDLAYKTILPLIMDCQLREAWPLASFFLTNFSNYVKRRKTGFHIVQARKKYKPALTDLKSSDHGQQFSLYRRPSIAALKRFSSWITRLFMLRYGYSQKKKDTKLN